MPLLIQPSARLLEGIRGAAEHNTFESVVKVTDFALEVNSDKLPSRTVKSLNRRESQGFFVGQM